MRPTVPSKLTVGRRRLQGMGLHLGPSQGVSRYVIEIARNRRWITSNRGWTYLASIRRVSDGSVLNKQCRWRWLLHLKLREHPLDRAFAREVDRPREKFTV